MSGMAAAFDNAQDRIGYRLDLIYIDNDVFQFKVRHMPEVFEVHSDGEVFQVMQGGAVESNSHSEWISNLLKGYVRDAAGNLYPRERAAEVEAHLHRQTDDDRLVDAMRILARDVQSEDGMANSAIREAADRIRSMSDAMGHIRSEVVELSETLEKARLAVGLTKPDGAVRALHAVMAIIDRRDARVIKPCE